MTYFQMCANSKGSFTCICEGLYERDADSLCVRKDIEPPRPVVDPCGTGFTRNVVGACEDVNECLGSPCGSNEDCKNTDGSFFCDCADNYKASADGSCVLNNCNNFPDVCSESQDCVGFLGWYIKQSTSDKKLSTIGSNTFQFPKCF